VKRTELIRLQIKWLKISGHREMLNKSEIFQRHVMYDSGTAGVNEKLPLNEKYNDQILFLLL